MRNQLTRLSRRCVHAVVFFPLATFFLAAAVSAQDTQSGGPAVPNTSTAITAADLPAGFVIGPNDVLSIVFWRDKDMSTEVTVRPDGKITLPLLDEMQAAGLTPAALRAHLVAESKRFFEHPNVSVLVQQINSLKVFITGQVVKPGPYPLTAPTTVLQLISMAGGLRDFADSKNITIVRTDSRHTSTFPFNYKDITRNPKQIIELKPGDTVVVP